MSKIGYLTFGRDDFGYGLGLCLEMIDKKKHSLHRVTPKTAMFVDHLLFSCFWWEHIYLLAEFLRKAGINKKNGPIITVGGFNTFNPVPFSRYAHNVVVGDGEEVLPKIIEDPLGKHEGVFREGDNSVIWQNVFPLKAFAWDTNNISRVEIARGCKFSCKFCAVAKLKPYREVPYDELRQVIIGANHKRVATFAPEPNYYSKRKELNELCEKFDKRRLETDVRLEKALEKSTVLPRMGIEGISEKLRYSIGKFFSEHKILDTIEALIKAGKKGTLMYFIVDLPGETDADWVEFRHFLHKIGEIQGSDKFLIKPSPNVFMPSPHTDMEYHKINWKVDYREKWANCFALGRSESGANRKGMRKSWKAMIAETNTIFKQSKRVLSMLSTRAGYEFFEIEKELAKKRVIAIRNGRAECDDLNSLVLAIEKYGGVEKYCGEYNESSAPWKVVKFKKEDYQIKK